MTARGEQRAKRMTGKNKMIVAIDGTFASGKGTLAKQLAAHYNLPYLDTGKLYRAVACLVMQAGIEPNDAKAAAALSADITPDLLADHILKSGDVAVMASKVAVHPEVRAALLTYQRNFAKDGAVMDGRDIGTVICPDAQAKLYVDAKPEERARRRHAELQSYGEDITFDTVLAQLNERDHRDMNRAEAPLKAADDAHLLDTTELSIEGVFEAAVTIIEAITSNA